MLMHVTRVTGIIVLTLFTISAFALHLVIKIKLPQEELKKIIELELSKSFQNEPVHIEKLDGGILSEISASGVSISDVISCKKVDIKYDLFGTLIDRGDVLPNIVEIVFNEPVIKLNRDKKGELNLLKLLDLSGEEGDPLKIAGKILIREGTVRYKDYGTIYDQSVESGFEVVFSGLNGFLTFINYPTMKINLDGRLQTMYQVTPVHFSGDVALNGGFWLNLDIASLDLRLLNTYIFPENINVLKGDARLKLNLGSLDAPPKAGQLPIDLRIEALINDGKVKSSLLGQGEISDLNGTFNLDSFGMKFNRSKFKFMGARWRANGNILGYDKWKPNILFQTNNLEITRLSDMFPFLEKVDAAGSAVAKVHLIRNLFNPSVLVDFSIANGVYNQQEILDIDGNLKYADQKLDIQVNKAGFKSGIVRGSGKINLNTTQNNVYLVSHFKGVSLNSIIDNPAISGKILGKMVVKGSFNNLDLWTKVYAKDAVIFGQKVKYAELNSKILPGIIRFKRSAFSINDTPLYWDAEIRDRKFTLKIDSTNLVLTDDILNRELLKSQALKVPEANRGVLNIDSEVSGVLDEKFWKSPLERLEGRLNIAVKEGLMLGQEIGQASARVTLRDQVFNISSLKLVSAKSALNMHGRIDLKKNVNLVIKGSDVDLATLGILKLILPSDFRGVRGVGNLDLRVRGDLGLQKNSILEKLKINGELNLANFALVEQSMDNLKSKFSWNGEEVIIENMDAVVGQSHFSLTGKVGLDQSIDVAIAPNSKFYLDDFNVLFSDLGFLSGVASVSGSVKGKLASPELNVLTDLNNFKLNDFGLDRLRGKVAWKDQKLIITEGVINQNNDKYDVNALLNLSAKKGQDFNVRIRIPSGNMKILTDTIDNAWKEIGRIQGRGTQGNLTKVVRPEKKEKVDFKIGTKPGARPGVVQIYRHQTNYPTVLNDLQQLSREVEVFRNPKKLGLVAQVKGTISGEMDIARIDGQLSAQANFEVLQGRLSSIEFDRFTLEATSQQHGIGIDVIFTDGLLVGGEFDELLINANYGNDGWLDINKFNMKVGKQTQENIIDGRLSIESIWNEKRKGDELNLTARFEKNSVGMLSMFNPMIENIENDGRIYLKIGGTLYQPMMSGERLEFKNAKVLFNKKISVIQSPFEIAKADMSLKDNELNIDELQIVWKGKDTQYNKNTFNISGNVLLKDLTFIQPKWVVFNLDLALLKNSLLVDLSNIYTGELKLKKFTLRGDYHQPISEEAKQTVLNNIQKEEEKGPVLKGTVSLLEGRIPVPEKKAATQKPSMLLDLSVDVGTEVFVNRAGLLADRDLLNNIVGNFDFELRKTQEPIHVLGSLNTPAVEGDIIIEKGVLSSFLKQFEMIEKENKKKYFEQPEDIKENYVSLAMILRKEGEVRRKIQPSFHVVASTPVELAATTPGDDTSSTSIDYKTFLVILDGPITDIQSITFAKYDHLTDFSSDPEYITSYKLISDDGDLIEDVQMLELYNALMPSLIKDLPEIISEGLQSETSQALIRRYTETQADILAKSFLRPIERGLARNVGLYDLKVKRNFGEDFNNLIGLSGDAVTTETQENGPLFGLDLVEDLIANRVFITLNTEVSGETPSDVRFTFGSYKLTVTIFQDFFLDDISANFQNRLSNESEVKQTFSVEANHRF